MTANGNGFLWGGGEQWNFIAEAKSCEYAKKKNSLTHFYNMNFMRITCPKNSKKKEYVRKLYYTNPKVF